MTEQEWLTSVNSAEMIRYLASITPPGRVKANGLMARAYDRKFRLFACACVRQVLHLADHKARTVCAVRALEVIERYADGLVDYNEFRAAAADFDSFLPVTNDYFLHAVYAAGANNAASAADWASAICTEVVEHSRPPSLDSLMYDRRRKAARKAQCELLRDIFRNPFQPVTWGERRDPVAGGAILVTPLTHTLTATAIARVSYDARDFVGLPVLADALEEADCAGPDILNHLRGPGPHVRGCWAVDLLLGKR